MKRHYNTTTAIFFALAIGLILRSSHSALSNPIQAVCQKFGQLFLNGLMMGVLPLILVSLVLGASKIALRNDASTMAPKVLTLLGSHSFFAATLASVVFFFMSQWIPPVSNDHDIVLSATSLSDLLNKLFPRNVFKALAEQDMVGLIVFFLFLGSSLGQVCKKNHDHSMIHSLQTWFDAIFSLIKTLMLILPLGVFALVCDAVMRFEPSKFSSLIVFMAMFMTTCTLYLVTWFLISSYMTGHSLNQIAKRTKAALISGFTTSSSAVSLPIALEALEEDFKVHPDLSRFLMPLGLTVNMAGTVLYVSLASLYITHSMGVSIDWGLRLYMLVLSWMTCLGMAGIPSGCLVALMIVLTSLGIPSESIGVLIGIDRLLDMFRTVLNLFGNILCTLTIHKGEQRLANQ